MALRFLRGLLMTAPTFLGVFVLPISSATLSLTCWPTAGG